MDLLQHIPKRVRIVEVGPRDGLQNEAMVVATEDKVRFVEMLADAGFADIEVSSFVSPKRVPQLADASEVFARLQPRVNVRYSALVPNRKGLERALEAGVRAIALFTAASETFTQKNIGMTIAESLAGFRDLLPDARAARCWVRAYVSTAFVCPYEGEIPPEQVLPVVKALDEMSVDEISVGDTIGYATPDDVARLTEALAPVLPMEKLAYHFHDTRGAALANVLMALQYGIAAFDSSAGGTGGCPFAPGAAGNLATEDLLSLLHGMGIETGVRFEAVGAASRFLERKLGRALTSKALQTYQEDSDD
ncbi:MAG TPA: hydroxymethylglutaryl-CoA lyase [Chthonomonadaceae bacterium]|nr:hydroxymethylglutaryl-CoA lyase [Chthonomonadaceae bacterium]